MKLHYKQYPPNKTYQYVSNFLEDLYRLYQNSCAVKSKTKDDFALSEAITTFLTKIYPRQIKEKVNSAVVQYVFILPSSEYTNEAFIEEFFRPFLANTPWIVDNDPLNKVLFYTKNESLFYFYNGDHMEREKSYMMCSLEKVADKDAMLLSIDAVRAVYDPDLILASNRPITALGHNAIFSPKLLIPTFRIEISLPPPLEKLKNLAKFLFLRVFADSEDTTIGDDTLFDYYYYDNSFYSAKLIQDLIQDIAKSYSLVS